MLLTPQETIRALALHVRAAVLPNLGTWRARRVTGTASSGDATFDIDDVAEDAVEQFIRENGLNVAYYSEDRGLIVPRGDREPEGVLIIDPIDGTRGAVAGFEACVVSVAWTDYKPEPTLSDVRYAAIADIKGSLVFSAERGGGAQIVNAEGGAIVPFLPPVTEIADAALTLQVVGAPMDLIFRAVGGIASASALRGGFFILNSSAFELTRFLTGQLAGMVDVRNRLLREHPETRPLYARYGGGHPVCLYGYDVAGAALIVQEAGGVVTDAWGESLADWRLLDTSEANFGSLIAAANPALHARLVEAVDAGFAALQENIR